MTDSKEVLKDEETEIPEFPYPKLIKLFDYYFPKTKGHKKINWGRILQVWALWAPWITVLLLILICCFMGQDHVMSGFAFVAFVGSFLNFVYYLVLAIFAKLVKRSPRVLLALTPRFPFVFLVALSLLQLLYSVGDPKRDQNKQQMTFQEAREARRQADEQRKTKSTWEVYDAQLFPNGIGEDL